MLIQLCKNVELIWTMGSISLPEYLQLIMGIMSLMILRVGVLRYLYINFFYLMTFSGMTAFGSLRLMLYGSDDFLKMLYGA